MVSDKPYFIFRQLVFGKNEIVVPMRGMLALLFLEVLNPFYVFQFFSFILWFADDYLYYAMAILILSAISIITTVIQTRNVSISPFDMILNNISVLLSFIIQNKNWNLVLTEWKHQKYSIKYFVVFFYFFLIRLQFNWPNFILVTVMRSLTYYHYN